MVISDPTIDPITGLPVLVPSSVIQQIPLGAQVFPFSDLNATAQPTRGPIYGDDIIPTSALVAGQHPTTTAAQSVHTDGNHALLVSDVGGGGGVAGAWKLAFVSGIQTVLPSSGDNLFLIDPSASYLYGAWALLDNWSMTDAVNGTEAVGIFLKNDTQLVSIALYEDAVRAQVAAPFVVPSSVHMRFAPPEPIDLKATCTGAGDWFVSVVCTGKTSGWNCLARVQLSNF